jgi:hypothetical protein
VSRIAGALRDVLLTQVAGSPTLRIVAERRRRSLEGSGQLFDVAAESYDRFMGRYSRPLAAQLADLAGVHAGSAPSTSGAAPAR